MNYTNRDVNLTDFVFLPQMQAAGFPFREFSVPANVAFVQLSVLSIRVADGVPLHYFVGAKFVGTSLMSTSVNKK